MPTHKTFSSKIAIAQRVLVAIIALVIAVSLWTAAKYHLKSGKEVADITFADGEGKALKLSNFKGDVVVLNLWATWCAPCVKEKPSLDALQQAHKGDGLTVVSLAMMEKPDAVTQFFKAHNVGHLTPYIDEKGVAFQALSVKGLPTTLVLNRDGLEIYRTQGAKDWQKQPMTSLIYDALHD